MGHLDINTFVIGRGGGGTLGNKIYDAYTIYVGVLSCKKQVQPVTYLYTRILEITSIIFLSFLPSPLDSILDAVFTVSPNRQYRGILRPTTPATHAPAISENNRRVFRHCFLRVLNFIIFVLCSRCGFGDSSPYRFCIRFCPLRTINLKTLIMRLLRYWSTCIEEMGSIIMLPQFSCTGFQLNVTLSLS